mmetsp:Transcript_44831/g.124307  ORF Transcript_44831/g.124307 Transcript_44831/m.124307 type:complete len:227 (-) Transcript_44831:171-851(-)
MPTANRRLPHPPLPLVHARAAAVPSTCCAPARARYLKRRPPKSRAPPQLSRRLPARARARARSADGPAGEVGVEDGALEPEGHLEAHDLRDVVDHHEAADDRVGRVELPADDLHQALARARDLRPMRPRAGGLVGAQASAGRMQRRRRAVRPFRFEPFRGEGPAVPPRVGRASGAPKSRDLSRGLSYGARRRRRVGGRVADNKPDAVGRDADGHVAHGALAVGEVA